MRKIRQSLRKVFTFVMCATLIFEVVNCNFLMARAETNVENNQIEGSVSSGDLSDIIEGADITPSPSVTPEISPEASPEISPEASPEISPETSPEVSPETSPEASPETAVALMTSSLLPEFNSVDANFYVLHRGLAQPQEISRQPMSNYTAVGAGKLWKFDLLLAPDIYHSYDPGQTSNLSKYLKVTPTQQALNNALDLRPGESVSWYVIKTQEDGIHVDGIINNQQCKLTFNCGYYDGNGEYVIIKDALGRPMTQDIYVNWGTEYRFKAPALADYILLTKQFSCVADADKTINLEYAAQDLQINYFVLNRGLLEPQEVQVGTYPKSNYSAAMQGTVLGGLNNLLKYQTGIAGEANVSPYLLTTPSAADLANAGIVLKEGERIRWYVIKWEFEDGYHVDGIIEGQKFTITVEYGYDDDGGNFVVLETANEEIPLGGDYSIDSPLNLTDNNISYSLNDGEPTVVSGSAVTENRTVQVRYSASPEVSPSPTPSASPEVSPSPTPSESPEVSPSPTPSESPEVSPSPTPSASPEVSPSPTPSASPEVSPSPTPSESPEVSPSPTPSASPEVSPSPTPSASPEVSPSPTPSESPVTSPSPAPSANPGTSPAPNPQPTAAPAASPMVVDIPEEEILTPLAADVVPVPATVLEEDEEPVVDIADEETPLAPAIDEEEPQEDENVISPQEDEEVIVIEDEPTPLASAGECWIHWLILLLTLIYTVYELIRANTRNKQIRELQDETESATE